MGIDPKWLIESEPLVRDLGIEIVEKAVEFSHKRDRVLAQMIIEELSHAMKRK